jgi:Do/DeqQ family serine protease
MMITHSIFQRFNWIMTPFGISVLIFLWILFSGTLASAHTDLRENAVVRAVRITSPAVVNISSEYRVRQRRNPFSGFGSDRFFDQFFRDFFDPGLEGRKKSSLGSGVIIDGKRGFILTNAHVIEQTGSITVVLKDEREYRADIVGIDPDSDLAVLRIETAETLPAIEMSSVDRLMIGETVIAIGNPFGFSNTVTTGVISAVNRSIRTKDRVYHDFIQIDASINPGNSGGPLLNINGDLIGINTAIYASAQGIGFAIPISKARKIVSDLIRFGEVIPAWIGITVQDLDAKMAQYLKAPKKRGIMITSIEPSGPAGKAGLREGDILLAFDQKEVKSKEEYLLMLRKTPASQSIRIRIWRKGEIFSLPLVTAIFPDHLAMDLAFRLLGVKVINLNQRSFHSPARQGVLISEIRRGSYLQRIGVARNDVIQRIDDYGISSVFDFKKAVIKYRHRKSVVILLQRDNQRYFITTKLGL